MKKFTLLPLICFMFLVSCDLSQTGNEDEKIEKALIGYWVTNPSAPHDDVTEYKSNGLSVSYSDHSLSSSTMSMSWEIKDGKLIYGNGFMTLIISSYTSNTFTMTNGVKSLVAYRLGTEQSLFDTSAVGLTLGTPASGTINEDDPMKLYHLSGLAVSQDYYITWDDYESDFATYPGNIRVSAYDNNKDLANAYFIEENQSYEVGLIDNRITITATGTDLYLVVEEDYSDDYGAYRILVEAVIP